ncbi:MAG: hypothetical protein N0E50_04700, partial [Candidatus Thiodiazotropha taylori]|nr:hypothetical protein [Candidatus Thiodiazotropha taylori]
MSLFRSVHSSIGSGLSVCDISFQAAVGSTTCEQTKTENHCGGFDGSFHITLDLSYEFLQYVADAPYLCTRGLAIQSFPN